jgi:hypothetical protein
MVKLKKLDDGVELVEVDEMLERVEKRVLTEWNEGKISILNQGKMSNREFKAKFDAHFTQYKKELKKLFRGAYRDLFNPLKTLEELEYMWYKYQFIGILDSEYVEEQRNRMYRQMQFPDISVKNYVMKIKNKIKNR